MAPGNYGPCRIKILKVIFGSGFLAFFLKFIKKGNNTVSPTIGKMMRQSRNWSRTSRLAMIQTG